MSPRKRQIKDVIKAITNDDGRLKYAIESEDLASHDAPDDVDEIEVTWPLLTANQVVSYNLGRARRELGLQQEEVGQRLAVVTGRVWSKASVSAAETAWRGKRARRFDANELFAFALILEKSIPYFFTPPSGEAFSDAEYLADTPNEIGIPSYTGEQLEAAASSAIDEGSKKAADGGGLVDTESLKRALAETLREHGVIGPTSKAGDKR